MPKTQRSKRNCIEIFVRQLQRFPILDFRVLAIFKISILRFPDRDHVSALPDQAEHRVVAGEVRILPPSAAPQLLLLPSLYRA
jgi:hypothetical protein